MAEVLGLGVTHWPILAAPDELLTTTFFRTLDAPAVPARYRDRATWPAELLAELGDDDGVTAARDYAARLADGFRWARRQLDEFAPDVVVVFGDDQYENFREDIVPPFCIFGLADLDLAPWQHARGPNRWGEPADHRLHVRGHRDAARAFATALLQAGVDMPYSYELRDAAVYPHAFLNTVVYLDWDRHGFPYPVVPFSVNCYGRSLLATGGGLGALFAEAPVEYADPPAPSPRRCMDVGAALARAAAESPWRVALVASASWSHAFLTPRNGFVWSDLEADRRLFDALTGCDWDVWRATPIEEIEAAGQHELLNWMVLAGAMEALGRAPVVHDYIESYLFTSQKCFAAFPVR